MTRLSFGKLQNVPAIGKISGRSLTRRNGRAVPRDSIINIRARARASIDARPSFFSKDTGLNERIVDRSRSGHREFSSSSAARRQIPRKSAPIFRDPHLASIVKHDRARANQ